jgi:aminocarboxymuconate-semialdehyde decarboxylase
MLPSSAQRIDVHAHFAVPLPLFADRHSAAGWPSLDFEKTSARLLRNGKAVRDLPPAAWSLDARVEELDRARLDHQLLSPIPPLMFESGQADLDTEWARHINTGLAHAAAKHPTRFSAIGIVPLSHPADAIQVMSEAKDQGLLGIQIGATAGERELDHSDLREFFQAAGELEMVIFVHPLALGPQAGWTARIDSLEITFGLGMTTDTAIAASRLVFGGTLLASPGLSVCLAHGGGSFAWLLTRIAHLWDSTHDLTADQMSQGVFVDSVVFDPRNLRYLVDRLGADRVLFGTDHPMAGSDSLTGTTLAELSAQDRQLVERDNARLLLGY